MTRNLLRAGALSCALLTSTCLTPSAALAQTAQPSIFQHVDANGVDLVDGSFNFALTEGSIGSGDAAIALVRSFGAGGERDNLSVDFRRTVSGGTASITLTFGNRRETFTGPSGATSFTHGQAGGATLTKIGASDYRYRDADGTVTLYGPPPGLTNAANNGYCAPGSEFACALIAISTVSPNGQAVGYEWDVGENCRQTGLDRNGEPIISCAQFWRLRGLSNSYGYAMRFRFAQEQNPTSGLPGPDWRRRTGADFYNHHRQAAPLRSATYASPAAGVTEITTDGGDVWRLTRDSSGRLAHIQRPAGTGETVITHGAGGVSSVTHQGVTTGYARSAGPQPNQVTTTVTRPLTNPLVVVSDLNVGRPVSVQDAPDRTTRYGYDGNGRLTRVTAPEENYVEYTHDPRGNVIRTVAVPKGGNGPAIETRAEYDDASCANPITCNLPSRTVDARNQVTDYQYDPTHGGVTMVTAPAPSAGADRPQTRYSYNNAHGEYELAAVSTCASGTAATCVGTAAESRAELGYDANGNVTTTVRRDGTNALRAETSAVYNEPGDVTSVDGPLPGAADTSRVQYDAARRPVLAVSPDPDGAGPLRPRAVRTVYTGVLPTATQVGTANADGSNFAALESTQTDYDPHGRPVVQRLIGSDGAAYALTHLSYDARGRQDCAAQRMNSNDFSSYTGAVPPRTACTPGPEMGYGPDRIARIVYDEVGRPSEQRVAVGLPDEVVEARATYTRNGQVATLTDGRGNRTSYAYDGHDRLHRTYYPVAQPPGALASNPGDYEELGYNASGDVVSRRLRDTQVIAMAYDALGRLVFKDLPGSEPDVSYGYDLTGNLLSAAQPGHAIGFTYDALGRQLTRSGPTGTMTSAYDAAGRRVRLTWMDGSFVTFEHLVTGETSAIHDAGGTPGALLLGRYGYDTYGRRTSLERGNGTMTTYGYDPASRLASLTHDLAGTAQDVTFSYSHNPAGQIVTRSSSNAAYNYVPPASTESAAANGLNQLSNGSVGALAHDGRGNVVSDGAETYAFTSENRLSRIGAYPIASDPLMRIYDDGFNRLTYDGPHLAAMHYGGSLASRHVFGPGDDEPLASRYGSGFTWYHADERGSVLARSGAAGTAPLITTWSEAGDPGTAGGYQFGFTGQLRLSAGVHDFKARLWSPRAGGRFMNPDPIGYGDGMNQYAYVAGDPVNATDPSGLEAFRRGGTLIFTKRFDASGNSGGRAGNRGQQGFRACPAGDICVNAQRLSALIDVSGLLGTLNASSGRYQGERSESANAEVEEPQRPTCLSLTEPVVVTQSQVSVSSITGAGIGLIGFRGTESGITGTVASAAWHVVNGQFGVSVNVGVGAASTLRDLLGRGGQIGISFGYVGIEFSTSDDFRRFSGVNVTGGPRSMGLSISRTLGTLRSISGRLCSTRE